MNCGKCKFEFCWICLSSYRGYRHEPGNEWLCSLLAIVKFVLIVLAIFSFVLKFAHCFALTLPTSYFVSLVYAFPLKDVIYALLMTVITDICVALLFIPRLPLILVPLYLVLSCLIGLDHASFAL